MPPKPEQPASFGIPSPDACTPSAMFDRQAVVDVVNALCVFAELHDWSNALDLLADHVTLDYTSMARALGQTDATPARVSRAQVIELWKSTIPGFDFLQHLMTNHQVVLAGETATCVCQVHAVHLLDGASWIVLGRYRFTLEKAATAWRVSSMALLDFHQMGDGTVRERAAARLNRAQG